MVVFMTVLIQPADLLSSLFLLIKASAPHPGISIAGAEEANPAAPASHETATAVPATATGGTPTIPSPPQEGQRSSESPPAPEGQQPPTTTETPQKPEAGRPPEGFVDTLHGSLSRRLQDTAVWLDSFFTNESFLKEENHSYVRVRYDVFKEQGTAATMKPSVDLRLALPQLERKTHLIFSAEPAAPPVGAAAPVQTAGEHFGTTEQRNLTAGVHYIFRSTTKESFLVRSGLQFSKFTPVVFAAPRYRALFPLDSWNMRFTQEVLYRTDSGWQTDTRFEFERLLRPDLFFRTSIDGIWAARVDGYLCSLGFSLRQTLNPSHALDYELINFYQASPGELTEVDFRVRYRHSFWRNWLFFEVSPQVRFPRDRKFEDTPGILFRLEMFIGETG
jgi:hypothetical protein